MTMDCNASVLYLFGGYGYDGVSGEGACGSISISLFSIDDVTVAGPLNDLFRYDIASSLWTWLSGSTSTGAVGTYGTRGSSVLFSLQLIGKLLV